MAAADGGEPGEKQGELPATVRRELAVIVGSDNVLEDSVQFVIGADATAHIAFGLETERLIMPRDSGILPVEPIVFSYPSIAAVGVEPPTVLSGRADFPRNFPHLNPVRPELPASICLARAGLQAIYDRYGVEGVMQRLRSWMRAAQTGGLSEDGWHPVPLSVRMKWREALFDAARFQELATAAPNGSSYLTGAAYVLPGTTHVTVTDKVASAETPAHNSALFKAVEGYRQGENKIGIPWLFVWPTDRTSVSEPIFGFWETYKDLKDGLTPLGLGDTLQTGIGRILANGCHCIRDGVKQLVIIVGVWRPVALSDEIYGLSQDPVARTLELKAFVLKTKVTQQLVEDGTALELLVPTPYPGAALNRWVSGTPAQRPATLLGYGALGSEIGEHLLRTGAEDLEVFETDHLAPHNLPRHRADSYDVYRSKSKIFETKARRISPSAERLKGTQKDLLAVPDDTFVAALDRAAVIIDATVNERMRARLSQVSARLGRPVVRAELFNHGRLGVIFAAAKGGNPDLFDLYPILCQQAMLDPNVEAWLAGEQLRGPDDKELMFGFGCSSLTTRMPGYIVAQHAAAFMPTIVGALATDPHPGLGINALDERGQALGWRWIEVREFAEFIPETAPEWRVRIHPDAMDAMNRQRSLKLPNETGGYLYGRWDLAQRRITIIATSDEPPGSKATPDGIELGEAGGTVLEKCLARVTRASITLCGSWHSHPTEAGPGLSPTDIATLAKFREIDAPQALPTLFVVTAGEAVAAHLIV